LTQSGIMIVDDNPANLKLLEEMLQEQGHEVRSFPLGRLALAAATQNPPDLILLDINMPEMNGYEVCERLKSSETLADIPVIFLSALNDTEDRVKAFQSGAVDYISKPFQFDEVQVRVETHLRVHNLQQALKRQNECLEEAVAARTRELGEANARLTILDHSKSDFLNLISHEFRTPLNGILGVSEIVLDGMDSSEESNELRHVFAESRRRLMSILDDALLLTQIDVTRGRFRSVPISVSAALNSAIEKATQFAASRNIAFSPPPANLGLALGDEELLIKALHALLETAVKYSERGGTVSLASAVSLDSLIVVIDSHGKTIPIDAVARFFDLFSIAEGSTPGVDLGLGAAVAHRILSLFCATASVANLDPPGVRLTISLRGLSPI
jgi:two-component system sensor histidine kinase/response regulator